MKKSLLSLLCLLSMVTYATADNLLSNSDFGAWADGKPVDWATLATSTATIEQTSDAHGDTSAVIVKGASSNKRFASKSYTLAAGTYKASAYVKMNGEEAGMYRLGYVTIEEGNTKTFVYSDELAAAAPAEWTEVSFDFTLSEETELALIVMNNKNGGGQSFIIDDYTLVATTVAGDSTVTPDEPEMPTDSTTTATSTIAEVIAAGAGSAITTGTVIATYARGFLLGDATGKILVFLNKDSGMTAGDVVSVNGTTSVYGGMLQFGSGTTVEKTGTDTVATEEPVTMTGADMDAYLTDPVIKYVQYTGTLTINKNYYNVAIEGAETAIGSISYPVTGLVSEGMNQQTVTVTGYTIGFSSSKYVNTMAVAVECNSIETPEEPEVPEVPEDSITGENLLSNSDIESWTNGIPDDWTLVVNNCSYEQSTEAHSGSNAVVIKGASSNKRFASKSYTLKPGTYQFGAYLKQVGDTATGMFRLGYAKLTNGAVANTSTDYIYITDAAPVSAEWTETTCTFTIDAVTEVSFIVMNSKNGGGASILVDDITLKTNDGGLTENVVIEEEVENFTLATSWEDLKDGKIVIAADTLAMSSLSGNYGYIPSRKVAVNGNTLESSLEKAYTLEAYDDGYVIKDANGKYIYMTAEYNSFNVSETLPEVGGVWYIDIATDGTATINNVEKDKNISLSGNYGNFGSYAVDYDGDSTLVMPKIYILADSETAINEVTSEIGEAKAIYDITGRRLDAITAPGIYIVNGKKVIIK